MVTGLLKDLQPQEKRAKEREKMRSYSDQPQGMLFSTCLKHTAQTVTYG